MKNILIAAAWILLVSNASGSSSFSDSEISAYCRQYSSSRVTEVDHDSWNEILGKYVSASNGINLVAYGAVSRADKGKLADYLDYLQSFTVTALSRKTQFAYWINIYNALIVQVILEHYPVNSIQEISYGLLTRGPWKKELIRVEEIYLSLDNIEHQILRPIFRDNRVHYALNCASIGCPNLQREAFTSENLEQLLDRGVKQYINHPRGASLVDGALTVSSIFEWYAEDFGENDQQILAYMRRFAEPELRELLNGRTSIDRYQYDWSLNEAR